MGSGLVQLSENLAGYRSVWEGSSGSLRCSRCKARQDLGCFGCRSGVVVPLGGLLAGRSVRVRGLGIRLGEM